MTSGKLQEKLHAARLTQCQASGRHVCVCVLARQTRSMRHLKCALSMLLPLTSSSTLWRLLPCCSVCCRARSSSHNHSITGCRTHLRGAPSGRCAPPSTSPHRLGWPWLRWSLSQPPCRSWLPLGHETRRFARFLSVTASIVHGLGLPWWTGPTVRVHLWPSKEHAAPGGCSSYAKPSPRHISRF
jgi:hypothetical protein